MQGAHMLLPNIIGEKASPCKLRMYSLLVSSALSNPQMAFVMLIGDISNSLSHLFLNPNLPLRVTVCVKKWFCVPQRVSKPNPVFPGERASVSIAAPDNTVHQVNCVPHWLPIDGWLVELLWVLI